MDLVTVSKKKRLQAWTEMVFTCRNSGMGVEAWCRQADIKPQTYYYRQRQVLAHVSDLAPVPRSVVQDTSRFVQLPQAETVGVSPGHGMAIQIGKLRIAVEPGVDTDTLEIIFDCMRRLC